MMIQDYSTLRPWQWWSSMCAAATFNIEENNKSLKYWHATADVELISKTMMANEEVIESEGGRSAVELCYWKEQPQRNVVDAEELQYLTFIYRQEEDWSCCTMNVQCKKRVIASTKRLCKLRKVGEMHELDWVLIATCWRQHLGCSVNLVSYRKSVPLF